MNFKRRSLRHPVVGIAASVCLASVIAVNAVVTGASATTKHSGPVITAKFALGQNYGTANADTIQKFDALVRKYTNGQLQITLYANNVLGTAAAQLQETQSNTIQFDGGSSALDSIVPGTDTLQLPYLFPSAQVANTVMNNGSLDAALWNQLPQHNLVYLGAWNIGFSDILTKNTPINKPSDLAGQKIRVFNTNVAVPEYNLVNADAINLSANQVVTGLATGTITGADNPPETIVGSDWYSEAHYLAIINMTYAYDPLIVSSQFWNSLSSSDQAAIKKALKNTLLSNEKAAIQSNANGVTVMKRAGLTITRPSISAFKAAFTPVYSTFESEYSNVWTYLKRAIQKASH